MDAPRKASFSTTVETSSDLPIRQTVDTQSSQLSSESSAKSLGSSRSSHVKSSSISASEKASKEPSAKIEPAVKHVHTSGIPAQSMEALPDFIIRRNQLFEKLKKKNDAEIREKARPEIDVVIDLGLDQHGMPRPPMSLAAKAWESTPGSFLRHVDKSVSADVVVAKVNGKVLWDLDRPLEYSCRVSYLPFTSAEGRNVFWHSSAHVLGEAAECQYNCLLSHGPPVEQGFFYDMAIAEGYVNYLRNQTALNEYRQVVKETDWAPLESKASKFFKEKQSFDRLHVSIADLKQMFGYSKYKMYYIDNLLPPEGSTVYRCGTLVDLCLGPHIQNTGKIKTFQIMKVCLNRSIILVSTEVPRILHVTSEETRTMIVYSVSME